MSMFSMDAWMLARGIATATQARYDFAVALASNYHPFIGHFRPKPLNRVAWVQSMHHLSQ
jgi:hypothetical protein